MREKKKERKLKKKKNEYSNEYECTNISLSLFTTLTNYCMYTWRLWKAEFFIKNKII